MVNNLIFLDFHRNKNLTELTDPCSICKDKKGCTCEVARVWWEQLAEKITGGRNG